MFYWVPCIIVITAADDSALFSPGEASHKARRMGLRHARLDRIGHRFVMVGGRRRGSHLKVAFIKRRRSFSVAWVQRERRGHHGHGYGRYGRGKRH